MVNRKRKRYCLILMLCLFIFITGCTKKENDTKKKDTEGVLHAAITSSMEMDSVTENLATETADLQRKSESTPYQAIYRAVDWEADHFSCGTFFENAAYLVGWKNERLPEQTDQLKRKYILAVQSYEQEHAVCTLMDIP